MLFAVLLSALLVLIEILDVVLFILLTREEIGEDVKATRVGNNRKHCDQKKRKACNKRSIAVINEQNPISSCDVVDHHHDETYDERN